jgi:PAS domain-containing protein
MLAYESLKTMVFGDALSQWESHLITVFFTATLTVLVWFLVQKKLDDDVGKLLHSSSFMDENHGVMITGPDKKILRVNGAFTSITGYTENAVIGKTPKLLSSGLHDAKFYSDMWDSIDKCGRWQGEVFNRRNNVSNSVQYFPLVSAQLFPLFQLSEGDFYAA